MPPKRPKVEPIRNPTLFEIDKLEQAGNLANSLNVERPYSEPGLPLGTSAGRAEAQPDAAPPLTLARGASQPPLDCRKSYASQ